VLNANVTNPAGENKLHNMQLSWMNWTRIPRHESRSRWRESDSSRVIWFRTFWPEFKAFHLTTSLLSEVSEGVVAECYALIRMRPLSKSCAESCNVISCGKVDYNKSGWRDDWRQMCRLCMSDSIIQKCETRSRWNAWWQQADWFWMILDGVFCRPDQCSRNIYVDDNSCLITE
jgi:hypothetical protein